MATNKHIIEVKTKGADKSKKQLKGVSSGLKSMAKSAALAAGAYLGARGLLNVIKSSLDLFAEQQLAEVKLESALGKTSATLKKYASALQQTTRFGDELILQGMAQLAFFIKDEEQLKIATKATLDLASAKGMDLVQAADLVAKSVGSSTNALSRYGIAAVGAVGSEERLLSITEEIANLFGGQAEATTKSYQGAMDQLSNSFGDMQERIGETLAPTIQALAETFNDLLSIPVSKQLEQERTEFVKLTTALQNANTSESTRKTIITELQTLYPEYIGNLDLEKASLEDIKDMTDEATEAMRGRIVLQQFGEELAKNKEENDLRLLQLYDLEMGSIESLDHMSRNYMIQLGESEFAYGQMIDVIRQSIVANEAEGQAILDNMEKFELWLQSRLDANDALNTSTENTIESNNKNAKSVEELDQIWQNFIATRIAATSAEADARANIRLMVADLQVAGGEFKEFQKIAKATAIAQTLYDTYESAQGAYKSFSNSPLAKLNPILYQALGVAAAIAATAAGLARVQQIKKAQYGADFVTDGPQMMMVGEGSGPERVQVTPLGDPNIEGPQGQGITLNITGNVLHDSFIEDNVIPQIREGLRLGENMGI